MTRTYPAAERSSIVDEMHGTPVHDPYRWLEDASDPRTRTWVEEQGRLTEAERQGWSMRCWVREPSPFRFTAANGSFSLGANPVNSSGCCSSGMPMEVSGCLSIRWNLTPPAPPPSMRG